MKLLEWSEEFTELGDSFGILRKYECSVDEVIKACVARGLGIVISTADTFSRSELTTADGEYAGAYCSVGRVGHLYLWEKD